MSRWMQVIFLVLVVAVLLSAALWGQLRPARNSPRPRNSLASNTGNHAPHPSPFANSPEAWPLYRGDAALTGCVNDPELALPDQLKILWTFQARRAVLTAPVVSAGRVFFGADDQHVYALDLANGKPLWSHETDGTVSAAPLIYEDLVIVGSEEGMLIALDCATGNQRWSFEAQGRIAGAVNLVRAAGGDRLLFGSYDNNVYCLDARAGTKVWTYPTENYINGTPAVIGNRVVVAGCDQQLRILSLADGKQQAQVELGSYVPGSPALCDGIAYVGHYGGQFLAVDLAKAEILWKFEPGNLPIVSSPAVNADTVVFGCKDKQVYALQRSDGRKLWSFATLGEVDGSPLIVNDRVVIGSQDGRVYMLDLKDGQEIGSLRLGPALSTAPAVISRGDETIVLIGAEDGHVWALGKGD